MPQRILPGLPPPALDLDDLREPGAQDPADKLDAALDRLADVHRRQDALLGARQP